ncbi:heterokaryon incompatibility protein-domain-containing protein [Hypoxylon trugodes]|uniref:heterokaryon incompatibility protein-domain-containing protein n=1 Tax=Hypoxylon trugodes TaxID=326681 RepID=UPI00218C8E8F|nr:heterokaryon incompatibility protein-domain-containing protein [Hypoxylon trugodes]KAI1384132.1 heterokaryon incompatibility protein-domain-containing protein [Hypoxylon trugodes]
MSTMNTPVASLTLDFESYFLAHLLRNCIIEAVREWREKREEEPPWDHEFERLESAWLACLDFFIKRLPDTTQHVIREHKETRDTILSMTKSCIPDTCPWEKILVLALRPSQNPSTMISCIICEDTLENPRSKYDILTYARGDPCDTTRIKVDGKIIQVTETLESALRHLRQPSKTRFLWVDPFCIRGHDEEGWQKDIATINSIFSNANEVQVWLGKESSTSTEAISFLEDLAIKTARKVTREEVGVLFTPDEGLVISAHLQAVSALMSVSWWDRAGLLKQLMSGCKIRVRCGNKSVDWNILAIALVALGPKSFESLG